VVGTEPEGLRRELEKAVEQHPTRFATLAPRFAELDPVYGLGLLAGLTNALSVAGGGSPTTGENDRDATTGMIDWAPILQFGRALLDKAREQHRPTIGNGDPDSGWIWCRRQVANLLARGLRNDDIRPQFGETVVALLGQLAEDPEPDEDHGRSEWREDTTETVRGSAIIALVRFALWQHKHRLDAPDRLVDPVRAILEAHLDPRMEPTTAIRAVYGQYFTELATCDPEWARSHVEKIFDHIAGSRLGTVAWLSFLRSNAPSQLTYDLLAPWDLESISSLSRQAESPDQHSADHDVEVSHIGDYLVQHVAGLYLNGIVTLGADSLVEVFLRHAPPAIRAEFMEVLGIVLNNAKAPTPDVIHRLRILWDWRLDELQNARVGDLEELAGLVVRVWEPRLGMEARTATGVTPGRRHSPASTHDRRATRRLALDAS
jgi:hypothetical protein